MTTIGLSTLSVQRGQFRRAVKRLPKSVDFFGRRYREAMRGYFDAVRALPEQMDSMLLALVQGAFEKIKARTPVRTGHARSGWQIRSTTVRGVRVTTIWNTVNYIVYLEYGWSQQAPSGMVRVTLDEMAGQLRVATARVLSG